MEKFISAFITDGSLGLVNDDEINDGEKLLFLHSDVEAAAYKRVTELNDFLYKILGQNYDVPSVLHMVNMLRTFLQLNDVGVYVFDNGYHMVYCNGLEDLQLPSDMDMTGLSMNMFGRLLGLEIKQDQPKERFDLSFEKDQKNYFFSFVSCQEGGVALIYDISSIKADLNRILGLGKAMHYMWTILDASGDGIVVVDDQNRIIYYNTAYSELIGLDDTKREMVTTTSLLEDGRIDISISAEVMKQKKPVNMIQNYVSGKKCLVTGTPVFDEQGEAKFVLLNVRNYQELHRMNQKALAEYKKKKRLTLSPEKGLVFNSDSMQEIYSMALNVAKVDSPVLLFGESGVGKEIIADLLHEHHPERSKQNIVKINCAAIPKDLLESELFGYEEGAFTGAKRQGKKGVFELANNGTLFLDEIGDLTLDLQVKLLRVLNDQQFTRLGGIKTIRTNARIIAATNKDLMEMVENEEFRSDLYYRLSVIPIFIPPLRDRKDDIEPLIDYFIKEFNEKLGMSKDFSPDIMEQLTYYQWPGNVRELKNLIERLMVTISGGYITLDELPEEYKTGELKIRETILLEKNKSLQEILDAFEEQYLQEAFELYGSSYKVAEMLGISQTTAFRKAKKYNIL